MSPFGPETEPVFWLPFRRKEIAYLAYAIELLDRAGHNTEDMEKILTLAASKLRNNDLLAVHALREPGLKLTELELEI